MFKNIKKRIIYIKMNTNFKLFLESKSNDFDYLKIALENFNDEHIEILIYLLEQNIINENILIDGEKLITHIYDLQHNMNDIEEHKIIKIRTFIDLCIKTGANINEIHTEDNEIVWMMIYEYVSPELFIEFANKYDIEYYNNLYYSDDFIDFLKEKLPKEYKRFMIAQKSREFNL